MAEGLYKRVHEIARARGMSDSDLEALMVEHGINYRLMYLESFASPDDIRAIAGMLQVRPSRLFESTSQLGELLKALFEEEWPQRASRISMSKEEAYRRVVESEYKWNSPQSSIRNQVALVFKALEAPSGKGYGCQYPDCNNCITRCTVTGRMIGAED